MLRWLSARGATAHQLIGDPGKVGRPVKSREDEYDPEEYDVIVVGGGEFTWGTPFLAVHDAKYRHGRMCSGIASI